MEDGNGMPTDEVRAVSDSTDGRLRLDTANPGRHRASRQSAAVAASGNLSALSSTVPSQRVVQALLHVSLYVKILVATAVLVGAGIVGGMWFAAEAGRARSVLSMLLFVGAGLLICIVVNGVILRAALWPLVVLERTARAVQQGDLTARVPQLPIGDPETGRLADTFNQMLANLEDHSGQLEAYSQELQRLSGRILTAQEEERRQVARELHDEIGQALTTLLIGLGVLRAERDLAHAQHQAAELGELARQALDGVRQLALGLHPKTLDDLGLVAGVRWYVEEWGHTVPIEATFTSTGAMLEMRLPAAAEIALYRVIQEALTNVARHSGATKVHVQLDYRGDTMTARIEDDGHGFDPASVASASDRGMGLVGMRERLALVGGTLTINSAPGRGTRIIADVPVGTSDGPPAPVRDTPYAPDD